MSDDDRHQLMQALLTEAVSIAAMLAVMWALQHTADLSHWWWKATRRRQARETAADAQFRQARRGLHDDIRRLEYGEG